MMLMAYLSYMLAEVRFVTVLDARLLFYCNALCPSFLIFVDYLNDVWFHAAVLFEWHSHSIFLWDCDVPLHLA